jgi:FKBP-type peptidyl-prolyl cis-trans isomerase
MDPGAARPHMRSGGLASVARYLAWMPVALLSHGVLGAAAGSSMSPEQAAHTMGVNLGEQLHRSGITNEVPIDAIVKGIKAGLAGATADPADQARLQAYLRSVTEAVAEKNARAAQAFLERNRKKPGMQATASGLQYEIIDAGNPNAASPRATDQVTVRYRGTLLDGSEFDGSARRRVPTTFVVGSVIKGWQEALGMMKPGAKWKVFVPPELGYGAAARPSIPGNSLLVFDLELVSVKALPTAPEASTAPAPNPAPEASTAPASNPGPAAPAAAK